MKNLFDFICVYLWLRILPAEIPRFTRNDTMMSDLCVSNKKRDLLLSVSIYG